MDINENIKRKKEEPKKEEPKAKKIFELECFVEELPKTGEEENYNFKGKVTASKMDDDLMSTILARIVKESVPDKAIESVLNKTAEKLGLVNDTEDEDDEPGVEIRKVTPKEILDFLRHLGE